MPSQDPLQDYEKIRKQLDTYKFPDFHQKSEEIHQFLIDLIDKRPNECSDKMKEIYLSHLHQIDYKKLSQIVSTQFYNMDIMKTMTCLISIVLNKEQDMIDMLSDIKVLDTKKKVNLLLFFTNLLNGDQLVDKKDRILAFKYDAEESLDEGMIGLIALNSLREAIPTFSWIYGFTKCNLPIFKKKNNKYEIVTACNQKVKFGNRDYIGVISEYISDLTLKDYLHQPDVTSIQICSVLLTIFISLKYANRSYKFVHWDLHSQNILMRRLEKKNNYIYLPHEKLYLWVGDKLATIIDYGFSSVERNGKIISKYSRPDLGMNPEVSTSPMNDVLKIVQSLYLETFEIHDEDRSDKRKQINFVILQNILQKMLNIKDVQDTYLFVEMTSKNYLLFPNIPNGQTIDTFFHTTLDELIEYVAESAPGIMTDKKPSNVLSCQNEKCPNVDEIGSTLLTRNELLTLSDAEELVTVLKKNTPELNLFIDNYLDKLFLKIESYMKQKPEKSAEIVFVLNEIRLSENELQRLHEIAETVKNEKLRKRIEEQQTMINEMIDNFYLLAKQSISDDEIREKMILPQIYAPERKKLSSIAKLQDSFSKLSTKSKTIASK